MKLITIDKNTFIKDCIEVETKNSTYALEFLNNITPNYRHFIYNLKINDIKIDKYNPDETTEMLKNIQDKDDDNIYIYFGQNNTCNIIYKKTTFGIESNGKKFGKDVMKFFNELLNDYIDTDVALFKERINYNQIYAYCTLVVIKLDVPSKGNPNQIKYPPPTNDMKEEMLKKIYLYMKCAHDIYLNIYSKNIIFKKLIATNELNANTIFNTKLNVINIDTVIEKNKKSMKNPSLSILVNINIPTSEIYKTLIYEPLLLIDDLINLIDNIMKYTVIIKEWIKFENDLFPKYGKDAIYKTKIDNELKYIVNTSIITYLKLNDDGTKLQNYYRFGDIDTTNNILKLTYNPDGVKYYNNENKLKYIVEPNKNVIKEISETKETTLETNKSRPLTSKVRPKTATKTEKTKEPYQQPIPEHAFLKPKKYVFGEFTKIFKADETNEEISNKMDSVVDAILNKKSVFMVTNGVSGSGKTSTLIGLNSEDDGIIPNLCCNICNTGDISNITVHVYETFAEKEKTKGHEEIQDRQFIFNYDKKTNILLLNNKLYDNLPVIHKYRVNKDVLKDKPLIVYDDQQKIISFKENLNFSDFLFYYLKVDRYIKKTTTNTESSISNYLISITFNTEYLIVCDLASVETKYPDFLNPMNVRKINMYNFLLEKENFYNYNNNSYFNVIYDDSKYNVNIDDLINTEDENIKYKNIYTHYLDANPNINQIKNNNYDLIDTENQKYIKFLQMININKDEIINKLYEDYKMLNPDVSKSIQNEINAINENIEEIIKNILKPIIGEIKSKMVRLIQDYKINKDFINFYHSYILIILDYYNGKDAKSSNLKNVDWKDTKYSDYTSKPANFYSKILQYNTSKNKTTEIAVIGDNNNNLPKNMPLFIIYVFDLKDNVEKLQALEQKNTTDGDKKNRYINTTLKDFILSINTFFENDDTRITKIDDLKNYLKQYYVNDAKMIDFICENINAFKDLYHKNDEEGFKNYLSKKYKKYFLIEEACKKRNNEILFTNEYIDYILDNCGSDLNIFNYLDSCSDKYNIIEKEKNTIDLKKLLFEGFENKMKHLKVNNLIFCMFTVINISPYHNNPPINRYIDLSFFTEIKDNDYNITDQKKEVLKQMFRIFLKTNIKDNYINNILIKTDINTNNRSNIIGSLEILDKFSKNNTIKYLCYE